MEEETRIDKAWHRLVDGGRYWHSNNPIVKAAYAHPTLRRLFPFASHGTLSFYRTVWPPSFDTPPVPLAFIICGGPPYSVYSSDYDRPVGEAGTVEEAMALVVAILPAPSSTDPPHRSAAARRVGKLRVRASE